MTKKVEFLLKRGCLKFVFHDGKRDKNQQKE